MGIGSGWEPYRRDQVLVSCRAPSPQRHTLVVLDGTCCWPALTASITSCVKHGRMAVIIESEGLGLNPSSAMYSYVISAGYLASVSAWEVGLILAPVS